MAAEIGPLPTLVRSAPERAELGGLADAFRHFTAATARLEREYGALRDQVGTLTAEVEEKNRLLAASLERERRLEAEALRQSRLAAMGEMAATLAHEVRNPLGAMELFTGLLLQDLRDRPETQRLAQQVARGITDLNHLVTNLLEFTRTRVARRVVFDCCALLDDAVRYTVDLCAEGRVVVERRYARPLLTACADPDLLRPVLLNLVRNALQAMAGGGTLTLGAAPDADGVRLIVGDTGGGIPAAARADIFRPFYTTRARGTGLGLAVVRGLTEAMGGRLEVDSEVGQGTTVTIVLPAGKEER